MTSRTKKNNVMTRSRFRSRNLWDEQEQGAQAAGGPQRDDAEKEIADIRKEAAQRGDPKALRRAAEMESWAEDNFAALEKLQGADHATQTWPARAPNCDGATALVLPDGPAGLRNMLDEMALPRIKAAVALGAAEPAVAASIGDDGQWEPDAFFGPSTWTLSARRSPRGSERKMKHRQILRSRRRH